MAHVSVHSPDMEPSDEDVGKQFYSEKENMQEINHVLWIYSDIKTFLLAIFWNKCYFNNFLNTDWKW